MLACGEPPVPEVAPEPVVTEPAPTPPTRGEAPSIIPLGPGTSEWVLKTADGEWLVGVSHVWGADGALFQHVVVFEERIAKGAAAVDPLAGVAPWGTTEGQLIVRPFTMGGAACDAPNSSPPTRCFAAEADFHCRVLDVVEQRLGLDAATFDLTEANAARRDLARADGWRWTSGPPSCGAVCAQSGSSDVVVAASTQGTSPARWAWSYPTGQGRARAMISARRDAHADLPHEPAIYTASGHGPSTADAWARALPGEEGMSWTSLTYEYAEAWTDDCTGS
jgi:hypothetical protein